MIPIVPMRPAGRLCASKNDGWIERDRLFWTIGYPLAKGYSIVCTMSNTRSLDFFSIFVFFVLRGCATSKYTSQYEQFKFWVILLIVNTIYEVSCDLYWKTLSFSILYQNVLFLRFLETSISNERYSRRVLGEMVHFGANFAIHPVYCSTCVRVV